MSGSVSNDPGAPVSVAQLNYPSNSPCCGFICWSLGRKRPFNNGCDLSSSRASHGRGRPPVMSALAQHLSCLTGWWHGQATAHSPESADDNACAPQGARSKI